MFCLQEHVDYFVARWLSYTCKCNNKTNLCHSVRNYFQKFIPLLLTWYIVHEFSVNFLNLKPIVSFEIII